MDKVIKKKKWPLRRILTLIVLPAIVLVAIYAIYKDSGQSKLNVQLERILLDTVNQGIFQEFIPITGVVEPIKTVYIDAIESGRVEEIRIENGSVVNQGQVILTLSNADLQMNYLNQEAQIVQQINNIRNTGIMMDQQSLNLREQYLDNEYRIDLLEKRVDRNEELYASNVISYVEFEETRDEYEHLIRRRDLLESSIRKDSMFQELQQNQMTNSLDMMQRNLRINQLSLDNLIIKAPIGGQLSSLDNEVGEWINSGTRIAQVDDLSNFKINARIDEFYINRIFVNQLGNFTFDGNQYELMIQKIYPEVANGTFEVDLIFTGTPPTTIKRGQTLTIKLALSDEKEALLVARGSFYQTTGGNWAYVVQGNGNSAVKRNIQLGRQNPSYYEVVDGLTPGDVVIVSSYENYGNKDILVLQN